MSTKKPVTKIKSATIKKTRRVRTLKQQRVLWLAQDLFARMATMQINEKFGTDALARASLRAAKIFWVIADKEKP